MAPAQSKISKARHAAAMHVSSQLTQVLRRMYRPKAAMIAPEEIIAVLNGAGVRFILMGNFGITGWRGEERASQDVDLLIQKRHHRKAVQAILAAFPLLTPQDFLPVTRFLDPLTGKPVIDLMKPLEPIYQAAFKETILVGDSYHIPNLEMALACKFAAMTSPNRADEKKHLDAADFITIVKHNRDDIRRTRLRRLGEKVYHGGGVEVLQLVDDIKAGRRIEI